MVQFVPAGEFVKFTQSETVATGDAVAVDSNGEVVKASSDNEDRMPAIGFVKTVRSSYCIVQLTYIVEKTGLSTGSQYWVGTNGSITNTVPGNGNTIQKVGKAISSTKLLLNIESQTITL